MFVHLYCYCFNPVNRFQLFLFNGRISIQHDCLFVDCKILQFNTNYSTQHYSFILYTVKWFQELLCITNNSIKHHSFVYARLNDQAVLFLTMQLSMSFVYIQLNGKHFYLIHSYDPIRCSHSGTESTRKRWQLTPHFPNLQNLNLTIWLFCLIIRIIVEEGLLLWIRKLVFS